MVLYTVFFDVKFNDKEMAKMYDMKFDMKSKKWTIKTKTIEDNEKITNASYVFKLFYIHSSDKNENMIEIMKSYNENYLKTQEARQTAFMEHLGVGYYEEAKESYSQVLQKRDNLSD